MSRRRRRSPRPAAQTDEPAVNLCSKNRLRTALPIGLVVVLALGALTLELVHTGRDTAASQAAPAPTRPGPETPAIPQPVASQPTATADSSQYPNVVVFLIDTLRADRLGAYGYKRRATSPFIDQIAGEGVVFEHACAPAPWTLPSVVSLFLSQFPCEHNILSTYDKLPDTADTLAERFKRLGYATYALYANGFLEAEFGTQQGFDLARKIPVTDGARAASALGATPPQPFLLYIHNVEPHDPYHYAPPHTPGFRDVGREVRLRIGQNKRKYKAAGEYDYRRQLPLGTNDLTAIQDQHATVLMSMVDDIQELYDAAVYFADAHVGSVVARLQVRSLWDNTIFIIVADHGEALGKRGSFLHDQSVYEDQTHVPLIIRFPHGRFAGRRIADPVSLVDVLPTLFDFVGRPDLASDARGRSLLPLVRGEPAAPAAPFRVPGLRINRTRYYRPWVEKRGGVNIIVRHDNWKGIWNEQLDTFELYDLTVDPDERRNVEAAHSQLVRGMREYVANWYARCQEATARSESVGDLSPETLELLRQLGYAE
jgi:arylsulfatase A-like enzyme